MSLSESSGLCNLCAKFKRSVNKQQMTETGASVLCARVPVAINNSCQKELLYTEVFSVRSNVVCQICVIKLRTVKLIKLRAKLKSKLTQAAQVQAAKTLFDYNLGKYQRSFKVLSCTEVLFSPNLI